MIRESLPVGIIVERRDIDNRWQSFSWHAVAVIAGAPEIEEWKMIGEGPGWRRYHAATLPLELFGKETEGYHYNLLSDTPKLFVVLRDDSDTEFEIAPFLVTACPNEAQDYLDTGEELVESVDIPPDLLVWIGNFVETHHVEEPFRKRKRKRYDPDKAGFGKRSERGNGGDGS